MARRQAGAGKPHSGGKAIVLAGHALRLTRMRSGSTGTCGYARRIFRLTCVTRIFQEGVFIKTMPAGPGRAPLRVFLLRARTPPARLGQPARSCFTNLRL